MYKHLPLILIIFFSGINSLLAQDTIKITNYGYQPNSRQNAVPYVQKAIEDCRKLAHPVLIFPVGRYDFWPEYCAERKYFESNTDVIPLRRCAILLENLQNLVLDAQHSIFIFHDRMQPLTIDHCSNITIRNVQIDWDIPLTAQAEVMTLGENYIDLQINTLESPYIIEDRKLVFVGEGWKSPLWEWGVMEFDRNTKLIASQTGDASCLGDYSKYTATDIRYGLVRLQYTFTRKPALGNYLVLRHSARDHAGTFIINSQQINLENFELNHSAGLGILSQYSGDLSFKNVAVVPNAAKKRILSGHDDGLHFSNCQGQIIVDSCRFAGLMDDPINVHGTSVQIIQKTNDRKLRCKFVHPQSIGFTWAFPGQQVGFIENEAMNTIGTGLVAAYVPIDDTLFEIAFRDPIPGNIEAGDALENLSWTPNVIIKNSYFGSNRARGILMSTPGKVIIENNIFESSGAAILIPGDANGWYESGAVKDVLIKNNTFRAPCLSSLYQFCEAIISICPEIPKVDAQKPFHRNIRIEGNTFNPFDYPVLYAKSTEGLNFNNNTIIRSNQFMAFHSRHYMISLEACKKITIAGNRLQGDVLGRNIYLQKTAASELILDKKQGIHLQKN
jgi:hypothetical protein